MNTIPIYVKAEDWEILKRVIRKAGEEYGECSWFGVGRVGASHAVIDRIIYPEQENDGGASDVDDADMAAIIAEVAKNNERIIWWGHSHGKMSAYYSQKDVASFETWASSDPPLFIGSCHNMKGDMYVVYRIGSFEVEAEDGEDPFVPYHDPKVISDGVDAAMAKMSETYPTGAYLAGKGSTGVIRGSGSRTGGYFDEEHDEYQGFQESDKPAWKAFRTFWDRRLGKERMHTFWESEFCKPRKYDPNDMFTSTTLRDGAALQVLYAIEAAGKVECETRKVAGAVQRFSVDITLPNPAYTMLHQSSKQPYPQKKLWVPSDCVMRLCEILSFAPKSYTGLKEDYIVVEYEDLGDILAHIAAGKKDKSFEPWLPLWKTDAQDDSDFYRELTDGWEMAVEEQAAIEAAEKAGAKK